MAFSANEGSWTQSDWRVPTGDWRFVNSSDAHRKFALASRIVTTEASDAFKKPMPAPGSAELDAQARAAILAKANVGFLHRANPQAESEPSETRFNPLYRFSATASSWTASPAEPKGLPQPGGNTLRF